MTDLGEKAKAFVLRLLPEACATRDDDGWSVWASPRAIRCLAEGEISEEVAWRFAALRLDWRRK